jgi:hypothetical protein
MKWILHPLKSFREWKERRYLKRKIVEAKRLSIESNSRQFHVVQIIGSRKLEVVSNDFLKHNTTIKIDGIARRRVSIYSTPANGFHKRIDEIKRML